MNLQGMVLHLSRIFGRRNKHFLPTLDMRTKYLLAGVCDLQDAIRKSQTEFYVQRIARLVARLLVAADYFDNGEKALAQAMSQKYPSSGCSNCGAKPCSCLSQDRPPPKLQPVSNQQLRWSLGGWHDHLGAVYAQMNQAAGLEAVVNRLFKEVGELMNIELNMGINSPYSMEELENQAYLEMADILAWICAAARLLRIDPEATFQKWYGKGCRHCRSKRCSCRELVW